MEKILPFFFLIPACVTHRTDPVQVILQQIGRLTQIFGRPGTLVM
jgi:hypothetical protein